MKISYPSRGGSFISIPVAAVLVSSLAADTRTWDNSSADGLWSTQDNWDTSRPLVNDDAIFPAGLGGTVTLNAVTELLVLKYPTAQSIQFDDNYTVTGDSFIRVAGVGISVGGGSLVTFGGALNVGSFTKSGPGTLIVTNGTNTVSSTTVSGGILRTTAAGGARRRGSRRQHFGRQHARDRAEC